MKKKLAIFVLSQFLLAGWADAQQAYFIDGYHGGIYAGITRWDKPPLSPRN